MNAYRLDISNIENTEFISGVRARKEGEVGFRFLVKTIKMPRYKVFLYSAFGEALFAMWNGVKS